MFKWLFGEKCEHDYHIIDTYHKSYVDEHRILQTYKKYILYCPKCDRERHIDADIYDREQKKDTLKESYKENR